jgi:hypothetical protein
MLATLLQILRWDGPAPEIMLESDGDICLDWTRASVSINENGGVAWACLNPRARGTDLAGLRRALGVPS